MHIKRNIHWANLLLLSIPFLSTQFCQGPARLTPLRSTSGAPSLRRCLTRGEVTGLRSTSDGSSAKFCQGPARLTLLRSASGAPSVRRCLTRGEVTGLRSTSDGSSAKFCQGPARSTPARSTCRASWVRRSRLYPLTCAPYPLQNHFWGNKSAQVFDTKDCDRP